jgi:hypothetical protein
MQKEPSITEGTKKKDSAITSFWKGFISSIKKLWQLPETKIILILILTRIVFILWTHWGMDFDYYLEIAQRSLNGEYLYRDIESNHMPLVDMLYIVMYAICPWKGNIIAVRFFMKLPYLLADIGIALGVMKIIEHAHNKKKEDNFLEEEKTSLEKQKFIAGLLVAISLPLILQTGGGRYDSLMIFCFTMIIYCLQINQWFGVAFFAALGTAAKYIGIIFLPFVVFWMKKEDIFPFCAGLLLGLIPIYPYLITQPMDFIGIFYLRGSHIAYGFSLWHAIFIIWNGFQMKHIDGIEATYESEGEPWFVKSLYLPFFVIVYCVIFFLYIYRNWQKIRIQSITDQSLNHLINIVFIPIFIFALSFKAINIQVLAWFTPYIALKNKKELLIEYSVLTLVNGFALIFFESFTNDIFLEMAEQAAGEGTMFYYILIKPALWINGHTTETVWVAIIFVTIWWYLIRTTIEFVFCVKEILNIPKIENISETKNSVKQIE